MGAAGRVELYMGVVSNKRRTIAVDFETATFSLFCLQLLGAKRITLKHLLLYFKDLLKSKNLHPNFSATYRVNWLNSTTCYKAKKITIVKPFISNTIAW